MQAQPPQSGFLPILSPSDLEHAALLIQQAYSPVQPQGATSTQNLQHQLVELQKRPEAWGLVAPFLNHHDFNVQFFGAHTAQIKIARDWDTFPNEHAENLRDSLLDLTCHVIVARKPRPVLRKVFVALASLALRLVPARPTRWPDWLSSCITTFTSRGASAEYVLEFLTIALEEVQRSDLLPPDKAQMEVTLTETVPIMTQAFTASVTSPTVSNSEREAALKCLEAWVAWRLPANDLTPLLPILMTLLASEESFIAASSVLQEILTNSTMTGGYGTRTLTVPLLSWLMQGARVILEQSLAAGEINEISNSLCKLLVALGDHSNEYIAQHMDDPEVQNLLNMLLQYTGFPGIYGIDEEESEMTLGFWYLLQEALWAADYETDEGKYTVSTALYNELVSVLRRKITWPKDISGWMKDQKDKFTIYRRDVGDTLINAYYVLRDDMLQSLVTHLQQQLAANPEQNGWEDVEATLHCIKSAQEAVPLIGTVPLTTVFSPEVLGRLPTAGTDRVRWTAISLIGTYSSWFTTQDATLLLGVVSYVVVALSEPTLSLQAANALREICDANRVALAPHIAAFGQLHAGLNNIQDTEKSKILQSIASVIQAMPPLDAVEPVEGIVTPIVTKLLSSLSPSQLPEEARMTCIYQLEALTGCAKGLTRASEPLQALEDPGPFEALAESSGLNRARNDPRMVQLRQTITDAIRRTMELRSADAETGAAVSDLIKAITALPTDATILSLSPEPLMELICAAIRRQVTAVWIGLMNALLVQLDPPSITSLKTTPTPASKEFITNLLPAFLEPCLGFLERAEAMIANPDVVQAFFSFLDAVSLHFNSSFYMMPSPAFEAVMRVTLSALSLQERYSLVQACNFLVSLIRWTFSKDDLADRGHQLLAIHGQELVGAVLYAIASVAPRSAIQNLAELLSALTLRKTAEVREWVGAILNSEQFMLAHPRATQTAKENFLKVISSSRNSKRIQKATQEFSLVTRGLEGTGFGYASGTV